MSLIEDENKNVSRKTIQWFPGHMAKAKREIKEIVKLVDLVIELKDARIPYSSTNPMVDEIVGNKPRLILLCKANVADENVTKAWIDFYKRNGILALDIDSISGYNVNKVVSYCNKALEELFKKREEKGIKNKTIKAMILGIPNVGKSTLMNQIIGQKIAITSNKPQTTRNRIQTVYTDERGQIVFVDTPGIHKAKNKLGEYMVGAAEKTISEVDLICWLVEPTTHLGAAEEHIVEKLKECKTPIVLVINKTDTSKKEEILPVIDCYRKELDFVDIVPVCARNGNNVDDLLDVIFSHLDYGPMYYDEDTVTDQPMKQIVAELIREKALHALNDEIPHGIAVVIDSFKERRNARGPITDIDATIICERDSHKGIIIGKGGEMLKKIGTNARYEIEKQLDMKVNLKLWVKVKKEWRDSDILLKNFGYDKKKDK